MVKCNGLQIRKVVSSNLTLCSNNELSISMHVDIIFHFPEETKTITVDLFDNPGVRAWAEHCATLPPTRRIIYQHIPGDIDTTVPVKLWPEFQRIQQGLAGTEYELSLPPVMVPEDITQHHLNVWHRQFTTITKYLQTQIDRQMDPVEQRCHDLFYDLNQLIHLWENHLNEWPKNQLNKYQGIDVNLSPEKNPQGIADFVNLTEEHRQYHSFDEADLIIDQSVHGKTALQSFIDNDDPNHWDTTGHWITHGGCKLVLSRWKQNIYSSNEFAEWMEKNNTSMSQLKGDFPLGVIRDRDQVVLNQIAWQFDNLHNTITEFKIHLD